MNPKARAIETALGAGVGALGGAATGGLSYSSQAPTEWIDDDGLVYSRPLDQGERQERRGRMRRAALLGAGLGAGVSLGGSAFRRRALSAAEEAKAPEWDSTYLEGLRKIVREHEDAASVAGQLRIPGRVKATEERLGRAKTLLSGQQKDLTDLRLSAAKARDARPFGGYLGKPDDLPHEELTHEGRIARHYEDLRKKHDLPPMQSHGTGSVGEDFFRMLLEKTSAVAQASFFHELHQIRDQVQDG